MTRQMVAVAGLVALTLQVNAQSSPSLDTVLERLRAYQTTYYQHYAATVAMERYTQERRPLTVILESEFAMVRAPGSDEWLGFRDVLKMNGKDVTNRPGRLAQLFSNPTTLSLEIASQIAAESARFNIGPIKRTVNNPATVLEILDPRHHHRFRWSKDREDRIGETRAWVVVLKEQVRPTIVRSSTGVDEPVSGSLWVNPANGTLLRAAIRIAVSERNHESLHLDVRFGFEPQLQMWVPTQLREVHEVAGNFMQSGEATYSGFKQFTVQSRIVSP